jgi:hypothetical protein
MTTLKPREEMGTLLGNSFVKGMAYLRTTWIWSLTTFELRLMISFVTLSMNE